MTLAEGREIFVLRADDPAGQVTIGRIPPEAHAEAVDAQHLYVDTALVKRTDTFRPQRFLFDRDLARKWRPPDDVHDRRNEVAVGVDVHHPDAPASDRHLTPRDRGARCLQGTGKHRGLAREQTGSSGGPGPDEFPASRH